MKYYVNLPLSWVHADRKWLELFVQRRMHPELGLDETSLALPPRWHEEIAHYIKDNGLDCSVHLPFFDLLPGSDDAKERSRASGRLRKAAETAQIYDAAHLIGHPSFNAETDALPESAPDVKNHDFCAACLPVAAHLPKAPLPLPEWLDASRQTWLEVLNACNMPLFFENTHDQSPDALLDLLEHLPDNAQYAGRTGLCFDIGHWFSFAGGSRRGNLDAWLEAISLQLRHLHLHDNNGCCDQHLGLGCGKIPLKDLFEGISKRKLTPGMTMEPHSLDALEASLAWAMEWLCPA